MYFSKELLKHKNSEWKLSVVLHTYNPSLRGAGEPAQQVKALAVQA